MRVLPAKHDKLFNEWNNQVLVPKLWDRLWILNRLIRVWWIRYIIEINRNFQYNWNLQLKGCYHRSIISLQNTNAYTSTPNIKGEKTTRQHITDLQPFTFYHLDLGDTRTDREIPHLLHKALFRMEFIYPPSSLNSCFYFSLNGLNNSLFCL